MKTIRLIVSLAVALAIAMPGVALGVPREPAVPETPSAGIIVKPKPGNDAAVRALSGSASGARIGRSDLYRVRAGSDPARTLAALRADPAVAWAEPDHIRELLVDYTSAPNDPDFMDATRMQQPGGMLLDHARSWYLRGPGSLSADSVWPYLAPWPTQQYGARAAASAFPVGVIDTGFYMNHPDKGDSISAGYDFLDTYTYETDVVTSDGDVTPVAPGPRVPVHVAAHGACVAGEVAAAANSGTGTVGVGYDTAVRVYKVQGICVDGIPEYDIDPGSAIILDSAVIAAIRQATDDGCRVITMSLGGRESNPFLQDAIDYAHAHGVLVVAATGNDGSGSVYYPAACDHVIGVGSYRLDNNLDCSPAYLRSVFTNHGVGLDLLAPGEYIWGLTKPDYDADGAYAVSRPGYTFWDGTSMATPLVAGAAAALWRLAPALTSTQLAEVLFRSARDMGAAGYETENGWGAFNMEAARMRLVSAYPELLAPTLLDGPAAAIATSSTTIAWYPVAGQSVAYRVRLDGSEQDITATTVSYDSLPDGQHAVTIAATSPLNWWHPVRSATTIEFVVDTIAPAAPTVIASNGALFWTPTEPDLTEHRLRIDGGPVVVVSGAASMYVLSGLTPGPHTAEVMCIDRAGNESGWGRVDFVLEDPPAAPEIGSVYTTTDGAFTIDWPDAARATSYRYVLDGSAPIESTDSAIILSDLAVGRYHLWVCATNAGGMSAWVEATLLVESSPVPQSLSVTDVEGTAETGTDRVGTAIAASRLAFPENSSPYVLVATARNWPDALGGGALAGALDAPILLVRPDELPLPVIAEIGRLGARHVIVLGGESAVSDAVVSELRRVADVDEVERIWGADRYETAAAIAERTIETLGPSWDRRGVIATGRDFPDALGGSPLCVANGWPVYLAHPDPAQHAGLVSALQTDGVESAIILGGEAAVPAGVEAALEAALGEGPDRVRRLGGPTRYDTAVQVARYGVDEAGLLWDDLAITRGDKYPDALAGGVLQGRSGSVLLLARSTLLPEVTADELRFRADMIHEVRFLGGPSALTPEVRSSVTSILAK